MTSRRKLLLWLLIIPTILVMPLAIWPVSPNDQHNGIELLFLIFGLPIFILNYLEWYAPQILDALLGKQAGNHLSAQDSSQPGNTQVKVVQLAKPGWMLAALLASVLVFGIILGAGTLALLDGSPANFAEPTTEIATSVPANPVPTGESATMAVSPTGTPVSSRPGLTLIDPTPTPPSIAPTTSPDNLQTTGCISPTQIQFDVIRTNIQALDPANDIKTGYLFKSPEIDSLWFFGAKIIGPDFPGGVTDPAIWAFSGPIEAPAEVYAVNDVAFQYSDFIFGPQANPPVEMQSIGAQAVFDCTLTGE